MPDNYGARSAILATQAQRSRCVAGSRSAGSIPPQQRLTSTEAKGPPAVARPVRCTILCRMRERLARLRRCRLRLRYRRRLSSRGS